ncbi:MAG: hypothetical protein AAB726_03800 [Patescibacteria group bacterium]
MKKFWSWVQWLKDISFSVIFGVLALALVSGAAFLIWRDGAAEVPTLKAPTFDLDLVASVISACVVVVAFMLQTFFYEPPKDEKKSIGSDGATEGSVGRSRPHLYIIFVPMGWWTVVFLSWLMKDTVFIAEIFWGILWEENPRMTIATPLVLDLVIFLVKKGKKNESPETKATGMVILAVIIVFWASAFGQKIWKIAEEVVPSTWTDKASTSITAPNRKGADAAETTPLTIPITTTDEWGPVITLTGRGYSGFDILVDNGLARIRPDENPSREYDAGPDTKTDIGVTRKVRFKSSRPGEPARARIVFKK